MKKILSLGLLFVLLFVFVGCSKDKVNEKNAKEIVVQDKVREGSEINNETDENVDGSFLMAIEDIFSITGRGTVATGRIESGSIKVGQQVELVGLAAENKLITVSGIEMFRKLLDEAKAGDNVGILLKDVGRDELERGQVLAVPGTIKAHKKFKAQISLLTKDEGGRHTPLDDNYKLQFYFRTTDTTGVINLSGGTKMVMPGEKAILDVELITPIAMRKGTKFAMREGGKSIGSGVVTEIIE